jgi:hypothetical protein
MASESKRKRKATVGCVFALIHLVVIGPCWFYLLWYILRRIEASDFQWFVFWAYAPASLLCAFLWRVAEALLAVDDD